MGKNSLNNFICQLSWIKKVSPTHTNPLKTIPEFSKPYEWGGVGHTWVWWGGVGHAVKQPKNDSPQNQDLTQPKSFFCMTPHTPA